uniref:Zinc transporter ZIP13 homolog n=1 Tax=Schistocephalus solidus TaxID=70667 RepID=A0A0X3NHA1_SCHSO
MRPCNITTLLLASISSILTGICGVFPVLLIRSSDRAAFDAKILNRWLSFATGSLVGDVFLHLLPEAWLHSEGCSLPWGVGLISGIAVFLCVEKISSLYDADVRAQSNPSVQYNDHVLQTKPHHSDSFNCSQIIGYLNLAANATDNFTHGLSIGVSYLTSNKVRSIPFGLLVPHTWRKKDAY